MKMNIGDIHPVDMVELHKQTSDMLHRVVLQYIDSVYTMENMVINIEKQLK
jgi:uncharacterized protein YdaL